MAQKPITSAVQTESGCFSPEAASAGTNVVTENAPKYPDVFA